MGTYDQPATPDWLVESETRTEFEGDVLAVHQPGRPVRYEVQRGGSNFDPGPDTWLTEHVLKRFHRRRVRITVEDLGESPFLRTP